ncbi:hypothetical protein [Brucella anthropi]|uniref:hypothetical protein n=1 Tax=Brucella anthropi TaxID=529 RepID=UPI0005B9B43F|nr:hypothetical protein [Brucella anthropi]KIU69151.1 hypothetical protein TR92_07730 [Brucella anthropi]
MFQFKGLSGIAFMGAMMALTPAKADWQYTKWGESLSSVLAKTDRSIAPTTASEQHDEGKTFGQALAKTTYEASGTTFDVRFFFTDERLSRVSLRMDNAKTAARIQTALGDQYGKPELESQIAASMSCSRISQIWRDQDKGNIVEFSGFDCGPGQENRYHVIYRPISDAGTTGL